MELANIEKLVEKYLDAETSIKEEQLLQEYFTSNNVAPHLEEYAVMFSYFKQSKNETFTKTIELKPKKTKKNFKWLSVAASVVLLFTAYLGNTEYEKYQQRKVFAQVKDALQQVSANLNKGNDALYAVSNNFNKGKNAIVQVNTYNNTVNNALSKLNY